MVKIHIWAALRKLEKAIAKSEADLKNLLVAAKKDLHKALEKIEQKAGKPVKRAKKTVEKKTVEKKKR